MLKKHAMGKIIGTYEESVSFSQPLSTEGQIYSGEQTTKKYFDFFGFRIPLFFKNADFSRTIIQKLQTALCYWGKNFLWE